MFSYVIWLFSVAVIYLIVLRSLGVIGGSAGALPVYVVIAAAVLSLIYCAETIIGAIAGLSPKVQSSRRLRDAVIRELQSIGKFDSVCDVGSGFGGMCGRIARAFPSARVSGIEIMPMPFMMSKIARFFGWIPRRVEFYFGDFFARVKKSGGFDVGVAYQLPSVAKRMESEIMNKFNILIVLDFPLPNVVPVRKIKLHHDFLGRHWMFVYKSDRNHKQ
jgi:hypothetical protein